VQVCSTGTEERGFGAALISSGPSLSIPEPAAISSKTTRDLADWLGPVGIHREFITAAARWIMEAKL
jgi:hypothetical protein